MRVNLGTEEHNVWQCTACCRGSQANADLSFFLSSLISAEQARVDILKPSKAIYYTYF